jgi:hypothetical protein
MGVKGEFVSERIAVSKPANDPDASSSSLSHTGSYDLRL